MIHGLFLNIDKSGIPMINHIGIKPIAKSFIIKALKVFVTIFSNFTVRMINHSIQKLCQYLD